jgi:transketolase
MPSAKVLKRRGPEHPVAHRRSADLAPSTKTLLTFTGAGDFEAGSWGGRNFHFGVREHAMGAVLNGLSLSKCALTVGLPDLQRLRQACDPPGRDHGDPVIYVFTHDSIGVGRTARPTSPWSSSSRSARSPGS